MTKKNTDASLVVSTTIDLAANTEQIVLWLVT
jgi:hypothetical protein